MNPARIDVKSVANTKRLLRGVLVPRVRDGQLAAEDEMGGQADMRVRAVVRVGAVGPGEDVVEAPGAHLGLVFPAGFPRGHGLSTG